MFGVSAEAILTRPTAAAEIAAKAGSRRCRREKDKVFRGARFKNSAYGADNLIVRRRRLSLPNVPRSWRLVTPLAVAFLLAPGAGSAAAKAFLPPAGQIFQGEAGQPISSYVRAAGKHPAVYQEFLAWGQYVPAITQDALNARSRHPPRAPERMAMGRRAGGEPGHGSAREPTSSSGTARV